MKKSLKILLIVLSIIILIVAAYVIINLFDETPNPNLYTLDDLPVASTANENGYYILWGLTAPENIDVQSDDYVKQIRQYLTPLPKEKQGPGNYFPDTSDYRKEFSHYRKPIYNIVFPRDMSPDSLSKLLDQSEKIREAQQKSTVLLNRYQKLIQTPIFQDFTPPHIAAPLPNLLAWLKTLQFYLSIQVIDAVQGNWEQGAIAILDNLDFCKRASNGSRFIIVQLIAKAGYRYSLNALLMIMNHPDCPPAVYELVLSRLPQLKKEDFSSRNAFIMEYLSFASVLDSPDIAESIEENSIIFSLLPTSIFLQKNRTRNYFFNAYSTMVTLDSQPPYQWQDDPLKNQEKDVPIHKPFWWLQNPIGKVIYSVAIPNTVNIIYKFWQLRVNYDLTRIVAEFHLKHTPGSNIMDTLNQLETFKTIDPFSGHSYLWNNQKEVLYSIGPDRKDNNGEYKNSTYLETDFSIPLKAKKEKVEKKDEEDKEEKEEKKEK